MNTLQALKKHQKALSQCQLCHAMTGPVVTGKAVPSAILLVGQAPGDKEGPAGKPFAWTAGKTMFKWFASIGLDESDFRNRVYMSAVCRCFPGKNPKGGDRVPSSDEIASCQQWLNREITLLQPELIIPVGKLAISQFLPIDKLVHIIGQSHPLIRNKRKIDLIPLPHPSGASTWHRTEPGLSLLHQALHLIEHHTAWQKVALNH
ncbi:MAG: uracil-DNA glycosylase family protein [Candidatus Thiodiazotropha sp.]